MKASTKVLITGATGYIGSHLAKRLVNRGDFSIIALARSKVKGEPLERLGIDVAYGDLTNAEFLNDLIAKDIDCVIHIAAHLSGLSQTKFRQVNVDATRNLITSCTQHRIKRFIFTSSIMVYGVRDNVVIDETMHIQPFGDFYADSKILAEQLILDASTGTETEICIVRPGMVYGPGSLSWTIRLVAWAKLGITPMVNGGEGSAFPIYIDNLIDLLEICITHDGAADTILNAIDDGPINFRRFLGAYMDMVRTKRAIILSSSFVLKLARLLSPFSKSRSLPYIANQLTQTGTLSNDLAKSKLGWKPIISLEEGMTRAEKWLRETGHL